MFKNKGLLFGIALVFILLIGTSTVLYSLGQTVARLENRVEVGIIMQEIELGKMNRNMLDWLKRTETIDRLQLDYDKQLAKELEYLYNIIKKNEEENKTIDNAEVDRMLSASVFLLNRSNGGVGAGTHIRIKNQDYVITCSHLIQEPTEALWIIEGEKEHFLKLMKIDRNRDLALYKVMGACHEIAVAEISDIYPTIGSEEIIIGNPAKCEDTVTEGIISSETDIHYGFTNIVWFGNSGGAMFYKNKIVGIVVQLDVKLKPPLFVTYGRAVKLSHIKDFLREFTE
jgi:S1-C subfamily serine protease